MKRDAQSKTVIKCKGIFFRYVGSAHWSARKSIEIRQSFYLLKTMSCPGCEECDELWGDLLDFGVTGEVIFPNNPSQGEIYRAVFVPGGKDIDNGLLVEWWWEMRKVEGGE